VGSVTTLLLAETKESERMDTSSSKQQRTHKEIESVRREREKRIRKKLLRRAPEKGFGKLT
jgi:hypothetical protein